MADRRVVDLLSTLQSPRWISRNRKLDFVGGASAVGSAPRARSVHRRSQAVGEVGLSEPPKSGALPAPAPASLVDASRPRAFARSRIAPSVRRRSSPQPQEGADALAPPPNDLTPSNRHCSTTCP